MRRELTQPEARELRARLYESITKECVFNLYGECTRHEPRVNYHPAGHDEDWCVVADRQATDALQVVLRFLQGDDETKDARK